MLQFEEYRRKDSYRTRKRLDATVSIHRRGLMSLSEKAFTALGSPQAVKFLIDKDRRLIGFGPCKPRERNACAVRTRQHIVSAVTLLNHMDADLAESRRYTLQVKDGLPPYIDLNEDAPVVTSNRRKVTATA